MQPITMLVGLLLAFTSFCTASYNAEFNNAYPIPEDHYLWGPMGKPSGMTIAKRATTTSSTKTSSSIKTTSTSTSASATSSAAVADTSCKNGPLTRSCWGNGYSVSTDFDTKWPSTGVTVKYNLVITNSTCNWDGSGNRICMLINGQYPGPVLTANWGDMLEITVTNLLPNNGTTLHWHGMRQLGTNTMDGVNGVTQCPIAPGDTQIYKFQATQYGTTWYHSHFSNQYGEGIVGTIIINGPATANYDIDLGTFPVTDFYYPGAFDVGFQTDANLQQGQGPPPADNILVNGTAMSASGTGNYQTVTLTPGKKHRLRLINTSVDNQIRVTLDGHRFQVITSDFTPIHPYNTDWILLAIGQRYDVIITANQTAGNYWFRAEVAQDCASSNSFYGRAMFNYNGAAKATPNTSPLSPAPTVCQDEAPLSPWWNTTVPSSDFKSQLNDLEVNIDVEQVTTNGQNIVVWGINMTAIDIDWRNPTLQYVVNKNTSYPRVYNLIELPTEGIWTYWIIQETSGGPVPIPHPMHIHGHDWFILGKGQGVFNKTSDTPNLNFSNPPRRDVTFLPGGGWVALAFPTDNPGAWLMHCHISWHISEGLGVQFLEAKDKINLPDATWQNTCNNWNNYYNNGHPKYLQTDSGL